MVTGVLENQCQACRLGVLEDCQKAMQSHIGSAALQELACSALTSITHGYDDVRKEAVQIGLLEDISHAVQAQSGSAAVAEAARRAISGIGGHSTESRGLAGSLELLAAVQAMLQLHKGSASLAAPACDAVSAMTYRLQTLQQQGQGPGCSAAGDLQDKHEGAPITGAGSGEGLLGSCINRCWEGERGPECRRAHGPAGGYETVNAGLAAPRIFLGFPDPMPYWSRATPWHIRLTFSSLY